MASAKWFNLKLVICHCSGNGQVDCMYLVLYAVTSKAYRYVTYRGPIVKSLVRFASTWRIQCHTNTKLLCRYEQILELVGLPILSIERPVLQFFCRSHMEENYNIQRFSMQPYEPWWITNPRWWNILTFWIQWKLQHHTL